MVGVILGWYLRRWWEGRQERPEPEPCPDHPEPVGVYEGLVTASNAVAGPLSREAVISEPDDDGRRELVEAGAKVPQRLEWMATMKSRRDGGITIRFQGDNAAREALEETDIGDVYRIEFHRQKRQQGRRNAPLAPWFQNVAPGQEPFGGGMGGMG